jgi:Peptidase family M28
VEHSGWRSLIPVRSSFSGRGHFPIAAYSEFMPPPRIGAKPYGAFELESPFRDDDPWGWQIPNGEIEHEVAPGFASTARQLLETILALVSRRGIPRIGHHHLKDNPYWSTALAGNGPGRERFVFLAPVALAKTQDDKGRVRWTLFGASPDGPARAFWGSFFSAPGIERDARESLNALRRILGEACGLAGVGLDDLRAAGFRVRPSTESGTWDEGPLPLWVREFVLDERGIEACRYLLTFTPFTLLPRPIQEAYLSGSLALLPSPASLVFWGSPLIGKLRGKLPFSDQLLLQEAVVRHEGIGMRVPQSGWLHHRRPGHTEHDTGLGNLNEAIRRTHRWQHVLREDDDTTFAREDHIHSALFSTHPDDVRLYGKPIARNAQIWSSDFEPVLHGPEAGSAEVEQAMRRMEEGGSFGYRLFYPPMQVGNSAVFWHRPLIAFRDSANGSARVISASLEGYLSAVDPVAGLSSQSRLQLWPRLNSPVGRSSILLHSHRTSEAQIDELFSLVLGNPRDHPDPSRAFTFGQTSTRAFEVRYWKTIGDLAEGRYVNKNTGDCVTDPPTQAALSHLTPDLDPLAKYLLAYYRRLAVQMSMKDQVCVGDIPFQWKTDLRFPWMGGWLANQEGTAGERDLIVVIPGKNRLKAVIMADHYDTAYMEDVYGDRPGVAGTGARVSAAGADDNHSATAALMMGARRFFELSRQGQLECDIWLVHLTGEEFPADCLGARALAERLVECTLELRREDGTSMDLSQVSVSGVFVLDMVAHNNDHAPDVFQIAPGTTWESLRLAYLVSQTAHDWDAGSQIWNRSPLRLGRGRGRRSPNGRTLPAIAEHLALHGEVRLHHNPRSTLFNTDGQIFSDAGVPVVLLMENYDINREGYHDSRDTMANIDLDYGAALAAIAIEAVARAASAKS